MQPAFPASFVTDTSTMCVFDIESLLHRLDDDCDWWVLPEDELEEVNKGNVAFVGLNCDGQFTIEYSMELHSDLSTTEFLLDCPSGRVFVGAAEEVTGEGLEPSCARGGTFLDVAPGTYQLLVKRLNENRIVIKLAADSRTPRNRFVLPVKL